MLAMCILCHTFVADQRPGKQTALKSHARGINSDRDKTSCGLMYYSHHIKIQTYSSYTPVTCRHYEGKFKLKIYFLPSVVIMKVNLN